MSSSVHDSSIFSELALWVRRQLGIVFSEEQKEQFADRVRSFLCSRRLSPQTLLDGLRAGDRALVLELAEVVSTNYTFFMRETETFDYLRQQILPALPSGPIRIWSAAASSGDEA